MINVSVLHHYEVENFEQIIDLKRQYWNYSRDSHAEWIENNIRNDDFHVLLHSDGLLIGYLNIIWLQCICNDRQEEVYGIGNVCIDKLHTAQGWGRFIVDSAVCFINTKSKYSGLLRCHETLVPFYQKCGWVLPPAGTCIFINNSIDDQRLMISKGVSVIKGGKIFINRLF